MCSAFLSALLVWGGGFSGVLLKWSMSVSLSHSSFSGHSQDCRFWVISIRTWRNRWRTSTSILTLYFVGVPRHSDDRSVYAASRCKQFAYRSGAAKKDDRIVVRVFRRPLRAVLGGGRSCFRIKLHVLYCNAKGSIVLHSRAPRSHGPGCASLPELSLCLCAFQITKVQGMERSDSHAHSSAALSASYTERQGRPR